MALFKKKRGDDRRLIGERRWCSERRIWVDDEGAPYDPPRRGERRSDDQRRSGEDRRETD